MLYEQFTDSYLVRFEAGEEAVETLLKFASARNISFAMLSGAGAVESARLGYWNPESKNYQFRDFHEQLEVVSFQGNLSLNDDKPFAHLHGAFARPDYSVVAGHIKAATVFPTLELWVRPGDTPVRREKDPATGLDLMALSMRLTPPRS